MAKRIALVLVLLAALGCEKPKQTRVQVVLGKALDIYVNGHIVSLQQIQDDTAFASTPHPRFFDITVSADMAVKDFAEFRESLTHNMSKGDSYTVDYDGETQAAGHARQTSGHAPEPQGGGDADEQRPSQGRSWVFTCQKCGATMMCPEEQPSQRTHIKVIYTSPTFSTCAHVWKSGVSSAHPEPVSDGTVVLVRKGKAFGAFIPTQQGMTPSPSGRVAYQWWYRTDGQGNLDPSDLNVRQGQGAGDSSRMMPSSGDLCLRFGPFEIGWSPESDGHGWIYYGYEPGHAVPPNGLRICVTALTDVKGINAADPQWHFKGTRVE